MVRITRLLTLQQYAASNRLALLHGPFWRRFNYIAFIYVFPAISVITLPISLYYEIKLWQMPGDHSVAVIACSLILSASFFNLLCPLNFRRRIRRLYRLQELDLPWTLEISDDGIFSSYPGKIESRFHWAYFDVYVETPSLYLVLRKSRLLFISIDREKLTAEQEEELHGLLGRHLRRDG